MVRDVMERDIAQRLEAVRERISDACARCGRPPEDITLVAVTKRIALPKVVAACRAGQWDLGENRIQDALPRQDELAAELVASGMPSERVRWHFIGPLQRNKAGKAVGVFHLVHAVDSVRLAERLQARAAAAELSQPVLVEVNLTDEPQKHGVAPADAVALVAQLATLTQLQPLGMMTMARFGASEAELHRTFAALKRLNENAREATRLALPHLSMGMSDDFEIAIAEGATIIRVGTAIFGPRAQP